MEWKKKESPLWRNILAVNLTIVWGFVIYICIIDQWDYWTRVGFSGGIIMTLILGWAGFYVAAFLGMIILNVIENSEK